MIKKDKVQLLAWQLDDQLFGAEIEYCLEVQKDLDILKVPHSKEYILGITNLRGDVVTVLDLNYILGNKDKTDREKAVIIRFKYNNKHIAIQADTITEVLETSLDKLEPANIHLTESELIYISKVCYTDKGVMLILNIKELFTIR